MLPAKKPAPVGRYSSPGREPANGLGRPVPSQNVRTAVGSVPDPLAPGQRVAVTVNRRVDVLEHELSHGHISGAAYAAGRVAQAVFERATRLSGGGQWRQGDRVDADLAHELAIVRNLEDAGKIRGYVRWLETRLGMIDARIVRRVLGDRMSYGEVATLTGKAGERGKSYVAMRFRDSLEQLAEAGAARGREVDNHGQGTSNRRG